MLIHFKIDENFRLLYWASTRSTLDEIELEVTDDHEVLKNPTVFKYENGTLIKDTAHQEFLIAQREAREGAPSELEILQKEQTDLVFTLMTNGVI
jgi:hypothetical protein